MKPYVLLLMFAFTAAFSAEEGTDQLQILVYGATGKIGTHVVEEALQRGHLVTAVSRDPSRIKKQHENLTAITGDLLDLQSIELLVEDKDIIIVSVRGMIGKDKKPENTLQYIAARNIVGQLRGVGGGAARLIHVGGSGSLEVEPGVLYADKIPRVFLPKSLEHEIQGQILALEFLRTVNDIDWSYATPAKNFTNGERTGEFRIGGDVLMEDDRGKSRISRADFAVALIDEAEKADHVQQRFSVAY
ncbi:MAG: NAD(P)H-binding protein [Woeseiaceae bacterium]|nr:NAD(P)H-binding protein [Woeseiaceae bacterium]